MLLLVTLLFFCVILPLKKTTPKKTPKNIHRRGQNSPRQLITLLPPSCFPPVVSPFKGVDFAIMGFWAKLSVNSIFFGIKSFQINSSCGGDKTVKQIPSCVLLLKLFSYSLTCSQVLWVEIQFLF